MDSTVLPSGNADGLFVAKGDAPLKIGLFAQEIADGSDDEKAVNDLLDKVFQSFYSKKLADFQLKESKEFYNVPDWHYSKFEEKRSQKVAFDAARSKMLHLHVTVISFEGKRIMAGFVRTFLEGDIAKQHFEGWSMGSGSGLSELRRLVHSITKEEKRRELRGGPPPAADPKRP